MKLGLYIKRVKAECRVPKQNYLQKIKRVLSRPYLIYRFTYNHHTLYASTTCVGGVSRTITRSLWPTSHGLLHIKGHSCPAYNFHTI